MGTYYDHKLKYRTFDQLLDSVADEWANYDREGFLEPSHLIKVVRKVNKDLQLRVSKTKERVIEFDNFVLNIPDDLENLNFALLCGHYYITQKLPQGTHTEDSCVDCFDEDNENKTVYVTECGDTYEIVQTELPETIFHYSIQAPIQIQQSLYRKSSNITGTIVGTNFIKLNVRSGKVYLNYEGILEDAEGNLLVVDHPLINDYYEYAIKRKVLENLYFAGEDVVNKLALVEDRYREAKREAYTVANTPDFKELQSIHELNRKAMYKKYYSIFL